MTQMVRAQIYLPKKQYLGLKRLAKARGLSAAELIWQAVAEQINAEARPQPVNQAISPLAQSFRPDPEAWAEALAFMKALQAQGPLEQRPRTWTRDDLYEERLSRYDRRYSD